MNEGGDKMVTNERAKALMLCVCHSCSLGSLEHFAQVCSRWVGVSVENLRLRRI